MTLAKQLISASVVLWPFGTKFCNVIVRVKNLALGGVMLETLNHRDDALLYIAYVMLIWAAPIPADRWHCSLWPYLRVDWHAP